ncbi:YihY family inner membrane protein [Ramlibacter sp.]|uniref:YihY family inner membrane protein n=1 Tax=Ramlibacter sp. TaxID=1917967 RepID=UPI002D126AF6|nr:YihY family inner membrane protein [Ramlibacter sp.]HWI83082.1 YihY family inner membrane protein [Ramlibacter sp.]
MPLRQLPADLLRFPWKSTALTLRERFREDRLGLTASSLTFTTTMALVPFFTVALAIFTAFPIFGKLQAALQAWLVQSLIPESIARQVLGYLTQFAGKANRLGAFGLAALIVTALALMLTIDRTLNSIWRVKRHRPFPQRVLIYWAALTLGPVLLGASLSLTSYVVSASRGLVAAMPGVLQLLFDLMEFVLLAGGLAALYRYVPNTPVRRGHAWAGGVFAALGIELARRLLAWYIGKVPTYSLVYGAFATVPILLVWIYVAWVVVLLGAVLAAYLPSLVTGTRRRSGHGWQFQVALEVLRELEHARPSARRGLSAPQLAQALELETVQLEPVLETLVELDWVGRLNEIEDEEHTRYVLLADTRSTALEPLMRHLLLPHSEATARLWKSGQLSSVYLSDVL